MASPEMPILTRVALAENWSAGWLMLAAAGGLRVPAGATDDLCGKNGWAGRRIVMRRIVEGLPPNTDLRRAAMLLAANPADPTDCAEIAEMLEAELSQHSPREAADAARSWRRLADGYGDRREEDPIRAASTAAHFLPSPQPENGEVSTDKTAPSPAELAEAPILDDWDWVAADLQWCVRGVVSGSHRFNAGTVITTSAVGRTNGNRTWVRTRNSVYLLGYRSASRPPIVRAAVKATWHDAFNLLVEMTGTHTLTAELNIALQVAELDWPSRHGTARLIADEMYLAGRSALGSAWLLLAAGDFHGYRIAHGELAPHASGCKLPDLDAVIVGWKMLGEGLSLGEDITDPVAAAHSIGDRHTRNDSLLIDDKEPDEQSSDPPTGVMVVPSLGGSKETSGGKEAQREFKELLGKRIAMATAPDVCAVRAALHDEFPHACAQIDMLLTGMAQDEPIRWRNFLLTGSPGGGKSRLVRRLAEALGVGLHRFDAAGSSDNAFSGTPRRWSTGEPCVALEAVRRYRIANPLILVDEIDKGSNSRHNGSAENSLQPFLEPETARAYPDPYVERDIDVSHVGYMLTCNVETALPSPLRDRLLVVRMPEPGVEHLPALVRAIVAEIGRSRGDPRWMPMLDDGELYVAESLWTGGSVRRLRAIVERILAYRETRPRN